MECLLCEKYSSRGAMQLFQRKGIDGSLLKEVFWGTACERRILVPLDLSVYLTPTVMLSSNLSNLPCHAATPLPCLLSPEIPCPKPYFCFHILRSLPHLHLQLTQSFPPPQFFPLHVTFCILLLVFPNTQNYLAKKKNNTSSKTRNTLKTVFKFLKNRSTKKQNTNS